MTFPVHEYRFVAVIALLLVAVTLLTDANRLPLALRGLKKTLGGGASARPAAPVPVPLWRRLLAFVLVLLSFLIAVL